MFSFFGDEKPGSSSTSGVIVSKAIKKTVVKPTTNNLKPSSTSRPSSTGGPSRSPALSGSSTPRRPSYLKTPSASSAKVKRKKATPTPSRIQSESESETSDDALDPKPKKKRGVGINGSRGGTGTPLPYQDEVVSDKWCLDLVDERGEWGRGWVGFIPCEEAVRGIRKGWASGYDSKPNDMDKYLPCKLANTLVCARV